ncbi:MAG TPA: MlaD family protein [Gemmatimonadaceae bacterium]|nr:MlaD family protein [Gemmatimonadaceae bacterium]
MPHELHWRELRGGITAVAVIVAIVFSILAFARVGALHGKKVTLYVVTDEAPGVLAGTEVWLEGEKDGLVTDVSFRPPTTDTLERLVIKTDFLAKALQHVRRDSYAQIRPGGTLIGTPIIYISSGTIASPMLKDGDTLRARPLSGIGAVAEGAAKLTPELKGLVSTAKSVVRKTKEPIGTIGSLRSEGLPDFPDISAGVSSLNARTRRNASIASALRGDVQRRASHALATVDSIKQLVASNRGNVGRFRKDTTLSTKVGHVLAELDTLALLVKKPLGTIAAVHSDSVLARKLAEERESMAALKRDIKQNPKRYIKL